MPSRGPDVGSAVRPREHLSAAPLRAQDAYTFQDFALLLILLTQLSDNALSRRVWRSRSSVADSFQPPGSSSMGLAHAGFCDAADFEDLLNVPEAELVMRDIAVSFLIELGTLHFVAAPLKHPLPFVLTIAYVMGVTAILSVYRPRNLCRWSEWDVSALLKSPPHDHRASSDRPALRCQPVRTVDRAGEWSDMA